MRAPSRTRYVLLTRFSVVVIYNYMVVRYPPAADVDLDRLFRALGDATRRDILRRTLTTEASVTALASDYRMSFAAVQQLGANGLPASGRVEGHGQSGRVMAGVLALELVQRCKNEAV